MALKTRIVFTAMACMAVLTFTGTAQATDVVPVINAVKVSHPSVSQVTRSVSGTAIGASTSDLIGLLNSAVARPSMSDAYAMSLVSHDRKSTVAIEARGGAKTILLTTTQSGVAPVRWQINSQTSELERRQIVDVLSNALRQPALADRQGSATKPNAMR